MDMEKPHLSKYIWDWFIFLWSPRIWVILLSFQKYLKITLSLILSDQLAFELFQLV